MPDRRLITIILKKVGKEFYLRHFIDSNKRGGGGGGRKIWKRARTCEKILSSPGYSTDVSPDIRIDYILFSWKMRERFLLQKPVFFEVFLKLNFGSQILEISTNIIKDKCWGTKPQPHPQCLLVCLETRLENQHGGRSSTSACEESLVKKSHGNEGKFNLTHLGTLQSTHCSSSFLFLVYLVHEKKSRV